MYTDPPLRNAVLPINLLSRIRILSLLRLHMVHHSIKHKHNYISIMAYLIYKAPPSYPVLFVNHTESRDSAQSPDRNKVPPSMVLEPKPSKHTPEMLSALLLPLVPLLTLYMISLPTEGCRACIVFLEPSRVML